MPLSPVFDYNEPRIDDEVSSLDYLDSRASLALVQPVDYLCHSPLCFIMVSLDWWSSDEHLPSLVVSGAIGRLVVPLSLVGLSTSIILALVVYDRDTDDQSAMSVRYELDKYF